MFRGDKSKYLEVIEQEQKTKQLATWQWGTYVYIRDEWGY
jgi:hypothetical protein